jgi:poly(3-hydroxybutyrate) depolymerase
LAPHRPSARLSRRDTSRPVRRLGPNWVQGLRKGCIFLFASLLPTAALALEEVRMRWHGGWLSEFTDGQRDGELRGKLFRPTGTKPAPFVVFLHGCGGLNLKTQSHWATFFTQRGVGFLMVDSFATRRAESACEQRTQPWPRRRADDAASALAWLAAWPFANPDRIGVMGHSHGGTATLLTLHEGTAGARGFVAGLTMYPGCKSMCALPSRCSR